MRFADAEIGTDFWYGPKDPKDSDNTFYISTPGEYSVTFWLKIGGIGHIGRIMKLDSTVFPVTVNGKTPGDDTTGYYQTFELNEAEPPLKKVLPGIDLYCDMLTHGQYTPVTLNIIANDSGNYEFRGVDVTLDVPVYLDHIDVVMKKAYPATEPINMLVQPPGGYPPEPFQSDTENLQD
jgi:hypothetical protein